KQFQIPLARFGAEEDIASAVVYMASPAAGWVTGQCLFVTGGR
ncbi:MAG: SDR family oxidoreductase, partial [Pseudomonadota bacterium]